MARTPLTLVTGPLGSGKTTMLRALVERAPDRMAILMNEFGEIAIDSKVVQGKNIQMVELGGGCVCCSLVGEFDAAVDEILRTVDPDRIVVETTGLAEPEALMFNVQESLPQVRLDAVVTLADADAFLRFPALGHTTRMQLEAADLILLNKTDLVEPEQLAEVEGRLRTVNDVAPIIRTSFGRVDPEIVFGIGRTRPAARPSHEHATPFRSMAYVSQRPLDRAAFEAFLEGLDPAAVLRAKGFVRFADRTHLFNYVTGRWDFEPFDAERTELVFIGPRERLPEAEIRERLEQCERACRTST